MTKKSFTEATYRQLNCIREWNGLRIANIGWHHMCWKLANEGETFDEIKKRTDKERYSNGYHTREELWKAIKTNQQHYDKPNPSPTK